MLDCKELTYAQMADVVQAIRDEVKERNPIFVNIYTPVLDTAVDVLREISEGEMDNPTSESKE